MTSIVLKHPTPKKYTPSQIHALVCEHKAEWCKLPELQRMYHSRKASRVTSIAWEWYAGINSVEQVALQFGVSVDTVHALGHILSVEPIRRQPPA